jgi:hypothetical protein
MSERESTFSPNAILTNALASSVAGIVSRTFTHPLDTAKARLQAPQSKFRGPFHALQQTFLLEGIPGLYRGYGKNFSGASEGIFL